VALKSQEADWVPERAVPVLAYASPPGRGVFLLLPMEVHHPGSVGKPIEGAAVRVVDDHGNDLPANQVGELLIRIGGGRRFYFGDPIPPLRHGRRAGCPRISVT